MNWPNLLNFLAKALFVLVVYGGMMAVLVWMMVTYPIDH